MFVSIIVLPRHRQPLGQFLFVAFFMTGQPVFPRRAFHDIGGQSFPVYPVALCSEREEIERRYFQEDSEDMPDEARRRFVQINDRIDELEDRPLTYDPADIARAGAFVSIDDDGILVVQRGYVRQDDKEQAVDDASEGASHTGSEAQAQDSGNVSPPAEPEDEGLKPLSERLVMELTAHRTLALRDALGADPDTAFLAALHSIALQSFYHFSFESCLEITATSSGFSVQGPDLKTCPSALSIEERHEAWRKQLPDEARELWNALQAFDEARLKALFAHCVGLSVNAVRGPLNRAESRMRHADQLAQALSLDMAEAGWKPTAANYLGRVSKAHILEAVTEAKGSSSATLIEHMRKRSAASTSHTTTMKPDARLWIVYGDASKVRSIFIRSRPAPRISTTIS